MAESRFAVGSSARISAGSVTMARATATRCCCPPDNSAGRRFSRPARPISKNSFCTLSLRCSAGTPCRSKVNSAFSRAVRTGRRLYAWKTKPRRCKPQTSQLP